ncbi:putative multidrug resistance protein fnx1 [Annulohypoxylon maeteangense]|uniref:putative multidrug resistance protein fnx1 n=1 Tax=Annulohypoxylon maeteangense TaxID=1927788 RepID=UPI0020082C6A|nr:putative multidrug resistance protein fnx1 [Annulohypoxylon maeteangense]KAI0880312.1 putative multidrug resistance protein fnx1 [Annulohypoxylon maeteangense]
MNSGNPLTNDSAGFKIKGWTDESQYGNKEPIEYRDGDALALALFLANLELTIIGTSLVSITNDLDNFIKPEDRCLTRRFPFITALLAGLLIWAKIGDHIGSTYAVAVVMLYELKPTRKLPQIAAVFAGVAAALVVFFSYFINMGVLASILISNTTYRGLRQTRQQLNFKTIDFTGAFLMLAALALLIYGLKRAAILLYWTSATVVVPIWISITPVFPSRFCQNREIVGLLVNSFITGSVSITCIIQLPTRYQTTVGASPLHASVRLLTLTTILSKNRRVPPIYNDWDPIYELELLTGIGMGISSRLVTLLTPYIVEDLDLAIASAAKNQFCFLGSAFVVSITTTTEQNFEMTVTIDKLSEQLGFNVQMHIVLGFAVASIFSIGLTRRRSHVRVD